jgi:excisionase family DNA binding protein
MKNKTSFELQFKQIVREALEETLPTLLKQTAVPNLGKKYLTVAEAVQLSGLSERQVRYLVEKREVAFHQPGRKISISAESLFDYLESIKVEKVPS